MSARASSFVNQLTKGLGLAGLPPYACIVFSLLLLFRLATYLQTTFSISGDGVSYMKTAMFIGQHRILPPLSIQPNGYGWLLSWFAVHKDPATALYRIGRFQQLLDLMIVLILCWLTPRILGKSKPRLVVAAWALILLQPFTGLWSRTIYSEQLVTFFSFTGFFAASFFLFLNQRKTLAVLGIVIAGFYLGFASVLRSDVLALNTIIVAGLVVYLALFTGRWLRWRRIKITALLLSYLAIPLLISTYQLASSGEFGLFTNDREHEGYFGWIRTWPATPREYEVFAFFSHKDLWSTDNYPAKAFDSEAEKKAFAAIMQEWKHDYYLAPSPITNRRFQMLTESKINRNPIRHYLINPLARISYYWFNMDGSQFYTIPFSLQRPVSTMTAGLILAVRLLFIVLFLTAIVACSYRLKLSNWSFQPQNWIAFFCLLSCAYVLLRTLELGILSSFMIAGLMELRFISIAMPFFIVGALLGARFLIGKQPLGLRQSNRGV